MSYSTEQVRRLLEDRDLQIGILEERNRELQTEINDLKDRLANYQEELESARLATTVDTDPDGGVFDDMTPTGLIEVAELAGPPHTSDERNPFVLTSTP